MPPAPRNTLVLIAASVLFYLLWRFSGVLASAPMVLIVALVVAWGFGAYFAFDAKPALRILLVTATPLVAGLMFEVIAQDKGYQYLALLIAGLAAFCALVGAIAASTVSYWRKRRSNELVA